MLSPNGVRQGNEVKLRYVIGLLLAFSIGAGAMYFWNKTKASPKQEIAGLREQITQAANRNLPLPNFGLKRIEIRVATEKMAAFIATIIPIAEKLGGSAFQGLDRGSDKVILATLPGKNLADFISALPQNRSGTTDTIVNGTGLELVECEIIIHPL